MTTDAPLSGILVTELGSRLATSISGNLLMQLGAKVVSVELPGSDDRYDFKGAHRPVMMAGKLSFAPRENNAEDEEALAQLINASDLVLTSSDVASPMERRALEWAKDTIVCDITAYGHAGPMAGKPASEFELQALTGVSDTTGLADGPPTPILLMIISYLTGSYATIAALSALYAREQQGVVQAIDVAMFDCGFISLNTFLASTLTNPDAKQTRLGNRHPTVAPWNTYRTSDGWVLICAGNQAQWERLCDTMGRRDLAKTYRSQGERIRNIVEIDKAIEAWTETMTTSACVDTMIEVMVACGPIAPIEGYSREANLDYRNMIHSLVDPVTGKSVFVPGSAFAMSETPGRAPTSIPAVGESAALIKTLVAERSKPAPRAVASQLKRPLAGIKIIELGQYTTAPLCAKHLAHLGAEIIKIERPGGDESRTWPPHIDGRSITFRLNNADKRSLTLDLSDADDLAVLRKLITQADVLVENLKPGALVKFGLPPDVLAQLNPRLVYCSISGFGADSLYPTRPAFDTVIQAMSGFMTALSNSPMPLKSGISSADTMGGIVAAVAILGALNHRLKSGRGQHIDLSMQDVSAWLTQTAWNEGKVAAPAVIRCKDGFVFAEGRDDAISQALAGAGGDIEAMSRDDLAGRLSAAGINAHPVLSLSESSRLPQTLERKIWFYLHNEGLDWPMLASPLRLEKTPPFVSHIAPETNSDGEAILREHGITLMPQA
jgi:crotonobetainyl-CoA:carnitine CoA-transferase CaiB-like acyl-CoA transferase